MQKDAFFNAIFVEYVQKDSAERNLSQATVRGKRDTLKRFINYLGSEDLTADNCRGWIHYLQERGLKPESIKHEIRILKATIRFLFRRGFIGKDFASEIPYPRVPKRPYKIVPAKTAEQVVFLGTEPGRNDHIIHRKIKNEMRQALRFILRTGLRIRELLDLKGADINLEDETFYVKSKSGNIDLMPLPRDMLDEIRSRVEQDRLFKVTRETMNHSLRRGSESLGISDTLTCHSLRHIFCTELLKRGVSMPIVSRLMRHSSVTITDAVYSHYNVDDLSLALNSRHPLIMGGLDPEEVFKMIKKAIEDTGVQNDLRFEILMDSKAKSMVVKLKLI